MINTVHQTEDLLSSILIELIVMIGAARIMNTALRRFGQPGVIGEIIAGLLLGPSLLGHFFPRFAQFLFGGEASIPITIISQIGLVLLMFQIGMDFEFAHLRDGRNARGAIAVALVSISVPFASGLGIGHASAHALAPGIDPWVYGLFVGVGLAITAVPILGRILREYGLSRTRIGVIAITAAAVNDVAGWILLAGVSAFAASRFSLDRIAWQVAGLGLLLAALWFALRPLVSWLLRVMPPRQGAIPPNLMAASVTLCFSVAICTYKLGIFAIFGGFAAGLLFHRHEAYVRAWRHQA
ncbi:MAG: cation:proton antiporter, partial [Gammaproteobacteria bacterium]|nr:cation:proton antiporter [Gammaproteobacteria bacterium]